MQPPINGDEETRSIEALLEDPEFQKLERSLAEPTLFDVLGIAFEERIHSKMLGWLLDPSGSHGLGATFLRRFLYAASQRARSAGVDYDRDGNPITPLHAETYSFSDVVLDAELCLPNDRRLDLILRSGRDRWVCLIENKILAGEGEEQTTSYYAESLHSFPVTRFRSRLFVFLSPEGKRPSSRHFVPMSYATVVDLLKACAALASNFGRLAIDQYAKCLERQIVEQQQLRDVCWKLYRTHRLAIDKIQEYGSTHLLGTMTADRVLEALRTNEQPVVPDRQLEWKSNAASRWVAIWPSHWPTRPGYYPLYYCVWFGEMEGAAEEIRVGIGGDGSIGRKFKDRVRELAGQNADEILRLVPVISRNLDDLPRAVDEGAKALVSRIKESFHLLDRALEGDQPDT